jgi:integrase/recombinase XerD
MLYLMLDTGLRLGEVLTLKVNQVDLKQCYNTQLESKGIEGL